MNEKLNITNHSEGTKMDGFRSISTSVKLNKRCQENAKVKCSICEKCYSDAMLGRYKGLRENLEENTNLLTSSIIPFEDLPIINDLYFRFESFGDLNNETQFENYLDICIKNPSTRFSIWTKNPQIMAKVFERRNKPGNLNIGVSSLMINQVRDISNCKHFVDFVFTVYTAEYAIENNITINCGGLHCMSCLRCYKPIDGVVYVNEMLKSQRKKYERMINS